MTTHERYALLVLAKYAQEMRRLLDEVPSISPLFAETLRGALHALATYVQREVPEARENAEKI